MNYQYQSSSQQDDSNRKRYGDHSQEEFLERETQKRVRQDDAVSSDESRTFRTRLIVSREDLPRVLGRGGQTINSIRDQTGGSVQAIDLPNSSEEKMILLEGQLRQVVESFDLVTQMLFSAYIDHNPPPLCSVSLLIEDNKAGKIVGQKAATIQGIKSKSGATQIRMLKPTLEIMGSHFRSLIIEGTISAISRAHSFIHELFVDSTVTRVTGPLLAGASSLSLEASMVTLSNKHVPFDAAMKFQDLYHYLRVHFGLNLSVSSLLDEQLGRVLANDSFTMISDKEHRCEFPIPKENAGLIIGKGGENLKALEDEFRMHIHVEKIPTADNKRTVVIIGENVDLVMRAKEKILLMASSALSTNY